MSDKIYSCWGHEAGGVMCHIIKSFKDKLGEGFRKGHSCSDNIFSEHVNKMHKICNVEIHMTFIDSLR
jgi:hypothetical protein